MNEEESVLNVDSAPDGDNSINGSKKYNGDEMCVILSIPKTSCHIHLETDIYENGGILHAVRDIELDQIRQLRNDYLLIDPDDDAFDTYQLTDLGLKYIEELKKTKPKYFDEICDNLR